MKYWWSKKHLTVKRLAFDLEDTWKSQKHVSVGKIVKDAKVLNDDYVHNYTRQRLFLFVYNQSINVFQLLFILKFLTKNSKMAPAQSLSP